MRYTEPQYALASTYVDVVALIFLILLSGCSVSEQGGTTPVDYVTVRLEIVDTGSDVRYKIKLPGQVLNPYHVEITPKAFDGDDTVSHLLISTDDGRSITIRPRSSEGRVCAVQVETEFSFVLQSENFEFPDSEADGTVMIEEGSNFVAERHTL